MDSMIGEIIGGCRIEKLIGRGGMGAVFKAHHLGLDIPVAVKILQSTLPLVNDVERFLREARTAARLRHPHIVGVLNVGCENKMHFIIMEYVEGCNLLEVINKRKKIPVCDAAVIAVQVLEALDAAYRHGIVHRDIKPENIIIDNEGSVRLADLGLARISGDSSLTQSCMSLGSPYYIAPEQAENARNVDHRSDLYSLGCTIFHMVSGFPPYSGLSPVEVILDHIRKPVPVLHKIDLSIPVRFSEAIKKMMAKRPEKRFGTALEVIEALKSFKPEDINLSASERTEKKKMYNRLPVYAFGCALLFFSMLFCLYKLSEKPHLMKYGQRLREWQEKISKGSLSTAESLLIIPLSSLSPGRSPVLQAVEQGNTEWLRLLLNNGASPNARHSEGTSPLHEAIHRGAGFEIELLLDKGANPNAVDSNGNTPLHFALKNGDLTIVRMLLENGANPNQRDREGKTPLQLADELDSGSSGIQKSVKDQSDGSLLLKLRGRSGNQRK